LGPKVLAEVLKGLPKVHNDNLLIGFNQADDAGIYKINDKQALVQTVDFFPPIVDDPYWFGQIAAANALSDIYAMGGTPLTALNVVGFPTTLQTKILTDILRGGQDKIVEAGATVVGGHTVKDNELKYGVSCTGIIDIDKVVSNSGAKPGDVIILTKPLGTGIITTAIKQNRADRQDIDRVTELMAQLNKTASELMLKHSAHAATDITGFGLLGHAFEMASASELSIEFDYSSLPVIEGALEWAKAGALTGGANANVEYLTGYVQLSKNLKKEETDILFDPQTSGGLLIALNEENCSQFLAGAKSAGLEVWQIGRAVDSKEPSIIVI